MVSDFTNEKVEKVEKVCAFQVCIESISEKKVNDLCI